MSFVWLFFMTALSAGESERVVAARAQQTERIKELFTKARVPYPPSRLYVRAFKLEGELELWVGQRSAALVHLATYPICARSGSLGPKRRRGDLQVPEGFYRIARFNPTSNYHLSLGLDYPNAADRQRAPEPWGGDIFIHGQCVTIGCIPIEDEPVEQLYVIAVDARAAGLSELPVHVFPRRLDPAGLSLLHELAGADVKLWEFWQSLVPAYDAFEASHRVPRVRVDKRGRYVVEPVP